MGRSRRLVLLLSVSKYVLASNVTRGSEIDPILQYRPVFARSLPVQLLVNGIVLTLMAVLLLQLIFTAQYHFRLAPVNYAFQFAGVCMLLTNAIASLHVIMSTVSDESKTWPYMLNYVAVDLPPSGSEGWSTAMLMGWLFMMAATGLLIQATHIQFLGLLFPSKLEKRLIFWLLGPLAATSAVMQLIRVIDTFAVARTAIAIQNVCNATLSLLFTVSLALWGLLVNRKNAWRMDGGTAAFGVGALILAAISTVISLVYIPTRFEFSWMKPLMWSVILWQSFFGWWWWVGAGMGVGELDELLSRQEKRQRKRAGRAKKRARGEREGTLLGGVAHAMGLTRRNTASDRTPPPPPPEVQPQTALGGARGGWILRHTKAFWMFLRHEHLTAARAQAEEWVERVNEVYGPGGDRGWGFGQFGAGARRVDARDADADVETIVAEEEYEMEEMDGREHVVVEMDGAGKGGEGEDEGEGRDGRRRVRRRGRPRDVDGAREPGRGGAQDPGRPRSMWWWGPFRRWRLQDSTEY
ncbi:uncharacterized protein B0H18DRAFT_1086646 [Fomitopsis serialis]|uniref:uncharacterized protein n=1 Tax=Fomitopsis serialis TaxID=139415 RepID=UPI002007D652|nr:uncharacterized protein B0H18DRAFT_1086646 [Neoantrodia serialis]KAH9919366.1 hypothetical protein B0H18DRAFT_1086646 [Neoantrodia serialis]